MTGGTEIHKSGVVVSRSKNLRGLTAYAPRAIKIHTVRDPANDCRGILTVTYSDGAKGYASFASHNILIDWVRSRRSWRDAKIVHASGEMGYLTRPGTIAGPRK
jgi:hypothetical protein